MRAALESIVADVVRARFGDAPAPTLEAPKQAGHGHFATTWALSAAKALGRPPAELAHGLAEGLAERPEFERAEAAGAGFVNLTLADATLRAFRAQAVRTGSASILEQAGHFARPAPPAQRRRVNVEFVSVNPNGPITVGSGRGAAFGSALCNVLEASGHSVHREYYVNDGVNSEQMRLFAESVRALALGLPLPEGGYQGDYVQAVADALWKQPGLGLDRMGAAELQQAAQRLMLDAQRSDLDAFGVEFDTWFSEQSLHDSGEVAKRVEALEAAGAADSRPFRRKVEFAKGGVVQSVESEPQPEEGGTLWLRSTKFGDDQDRVLRRSDGRLTYIASDVAYHADKFSRGTPPGPDGAHESADKLVTVLGPDHHGYVARLHAVVAAVLGGAAAQDGGPLEGTDALLYDSPGERDACRAALAESRDKLEVVIFQLVRFVKDGKPAPMRKRDGNVYALIDLVREIGAHVRPGAPEPEQLAAGRDVARFFYLMRNHETTFDFDLDLAEREGDENPVFYVQYAHARICGILRKAAEAGLEPDPDSGTPLEPSEAALLVRALDVAHDVARTAQDYAVNRLATAALEVARAFHPFYDSCRVVEPAEPERSQGRLATCEAVRASLKALLDLLGVSAPESMTRTEA